MASKYDPLGEYLNKRGESPVTLTFREIESVLKFPLPKSARQYQEWWNPGGNHSHADAWFACGWEAETVDLGGRWVTFRRVR